MPGGAMLGMAVLGLARRGTPRAGPTEMAVRQFMMTRTTTTPARRRPDFDPDRPFQPKENVFVRRNGRWEPAVVIFCPKRHSRTKKKPYEYVVRVRLLADQGIQVYFAPDDVAREMPSENQ